MNSIAAVVVNANWTASVVTFTIRKNSVALVMPGKGVVSLDSAPVSFFTAIGVLVMEVSFELSGGFLVRGKTSILLSTQMIQSRVTPFVVRKVVMLGALPVQSAVKLPPADSKHWAGLWSTGGTNPARVQFSVS